MSFWTELPLPTEKEILVGFYDLTGYTKYSAANEAQTVLNVMAGYFACTGAIIKNAGGYFLKTLGDAGMAVFPGHVADAGVHAFIAVRTEGDAWLRNQGYRGTAKVKLHLGPVALGLVGAPGEERLDAYGKTVNTAAVLESHGLAMTAAVFRALAPETRRMFKKHTPPIS